jgi:hypothetical protein
MSEPTTGTPAPDPSTTPPEGTAVPDPSAETPEPTEDFDPARAMEKIRKANAEAKALRDRAKAAEGAQATAEQKAKDLESAAARIPDLEAQLVRERIARKLSLPDALVDRLRGTTEGEVMADAESLVALVAPRAKSTRPVESLQTGTGKADSGGPAQLSRLDLLGMSPAQIEAARVAGQLADLMAGKST